MGILQPDVGHGGRGRESRLSRPPKAITVYSLRHARAAASAAAATGVPLLLLSAASAAATTGPSWFKALSGRIAGEFPDARIEPVLDCGNLPGYAMAALRCGLTSIRYDGPSAESIEDIAQKSGATVLRKRPASLDLAHDAGESVANDLEAMCRRWLSTEGKLEKK